MFVYCIFHVYIYLSIEFHKWTVIFIKYSLLNTMTSVTEITVKLCNTGYTRLTVYVSFHRITGLNAIIQLVYFSLITNITRIACTRETNSQFVN